MEPAVRSKTLRTVNLATRAMRANYYDEIHNTFKKQQALNADPKLFIGIIL